MYYPYTFGMRVAMARKISIDVTDDLDGTPLGDNALYAGTEFSLNDQRFRIDLSEANYERLLQALQPFMDVAEKVKATPSPKKTSLEPAGSPTAAVRDWARQNGYTVSDRGRIPHAVLDAFAESQGS